MSRGRMRWMRGLGVVLIVPLFLGLGGCWLFNVPPTASFTASPIVIEVGGTINFSAITSVDQDGSIVSYAWDFGDGSDGTGRSVSHAYNTVGTFTVILLVTDNDGETGRTQKNIYVEEGEAPGPQASFTASPSSGNSPLSVWFDASGSSYDKTPLTFTWSFGDGTNGYGQQVNHLYTSAAGATYTATLTVTGPDGKQGTAEQVITVSGAGGQPGPAGAPSARFDILFDDPGPPEEVQYENDEVAPVRAWFDPEDSEADEDRVIASYTWTFGDGSSTHTIDSQPVSHTYVTDEDAEVFSVTLVVIDDEGALDDITKTVRAENYQPVAGFEIYDTLIDDDEIGDEATDLDDQDDFAGGAWVADDVSYNSVQTGTTTVFIRSEQVENAWVRDEPEDRLDPTPQGGENAEPDSETGVEFDEDEFCFDPEGQGWSPTDKSVKPAWWPNAGWGIEFIEINWGDGNTRTYDYYDWVMNGADTFYHTYAFDNTTKTYTITVTARDFLGAEDSFSRQVRLIVGN